MRKQYNFHPGVEGLDAWDVDNLIDKSADLTYPIILSSDGRVMDGMHRVARALLEGETSIRAVQFRQDPPPDHRNCRPDDLPYPEGVAD